MPKDFHADLKEKLAQRGLLKEALINPGGVSFDVSGGGLTDQLNPMNRQPDPRSQVVQTPSKTKMRQRDKAIEYNNAVDERLSGNTNPYDRMVDHYKPVNDNITTEHKRFTGPEQRKVPNPKGVGAPVNAPYNKTDLNQELRRLYPGLFEGVGKHEEPEYVGKHEQAPGLFDRFRQWLSDKFNGGYIGKHDAPSGERARANPGGEVNEIWDGRPQQNSYEMIPKKRQDPNEMMLLLTAAEEINKLVCEALIVENDFNIVTAAMSEIGYNPHTILSALSE